MRFVFLRVLKVQKICVNCPARFVTDFLSCECTWRDGPAKFRPGSPVNIDWGARLGHGSFPCSSSTKVFGPETEYDTREEWGRKRFYD